MNCSICGNALGAVSVGIGDGAGTRLSHRECRDAELKAREVVCLHGLNDPRCECWAIWQTVPGCVGWRYRGDRVLRGCGAAIAEQVAWSNRHLRGDTYSAKLYDVATKWLTREEVTDPAHLCSHGDTDPDCRCYGVWFDTTHEWMRQRSSDGELSTGNLRAMSQLAYSANKIPQAAGHEGTWSPQVRASQSFFHPEKDVIEIARRIKTNEHRCALPWCERRITTEAACCSALCERAEAQRCEVEKTVAELAASCTQGETWSKERVTQMCAQRLAALARIEQSWRALQYELPRGNESVFAIIEDD